MSTTIIQLLASGLILGLIEALLSAEGPSAIALIGVVLGSFWLLQLWLPGLRREALSSASFTLFVLLLALWVWESRPGALGGLLLGLAVAAWQLERLAKRWDGVRLNFEAKAVMGQELWQLGLLSATGLGLALVSALGTVSLSFPLALVLLGVAAWGLTTVWRIVASQPSRSK